MNRSKNRIFTIIGTIFLLILLLACVSPKSEAEMVQECKKDPQCHPAPDAVMIQIYQTQEAGK